MLETPPETPVKKEPLLITLDNLLYRKLFEHAWPKPVVRIFKLASRLGDGYGWIIYGAIFFLMAHFGHTFTYATAVYFFIRGLVAALLGSMVFWFVKTSVNRKRPYLKHRNKAPYMRPPDKYSFPSGHTLTAFAILVTTGLASPILLSIAIALALMIMISRVLMGVHYPLDVIAGAAIGVCVGFATNGLFYFIIGPQPIL